MERIYYNQGFNFRISKDLFWRNLEIWFILLIDQKWEIMKISIYVKREFSKIQHPAPNKREWVNTSLTWSGIFKDVFNPMPKVITNTAKIRK